jgi:hypothetical protein
MPPGASAGGRDLLSASAHAGPAEQISSSGGSLIPRMNGVAVIPGYLPPQCIAGVGDPDSAKRPRRPYHEV